MSIGRRRFVSLLGSAIMASPHPAAAQQRELPLIGFLHAATAESTHPMRPDSLKVWKSKALRKRRTSLSHTTLPTVGSIGCRRSRLISSAVRSL
jgi:hypothetical protein